MKIRKQNNTRSDIGRGVTGDGLSMAVACVVIMCLLAWPAMGWAGPGRIGVVDYARGAVTAKGGDGELRILGKGSPLHEKDVLTTGKNGMAVIRLNDDSRITVRPNTVFGMEEYAHGEKKESAIFRLFKGGIRALTGLIAKRNPNNGVRVHTATAVVGVRGTDFEVRTCGEEDCSQRDDNKEAKAAPVQSPLAGRVVRLKGKLTVQSAEGTLRQVRNGGAVHEGDILETETGGFAVVVFRDQSRVSLQSGTRFEVETYRYEAEKKGNVFFRLFKGGLRLMTGLMAKRNPESFKIGTPTAVVGVRGTELGIFAGVDLIKEALGQLGADPTKLADAKTTTLLVLDGIGTMTAGKQTWQYGRGKTIIIGPGMPKPTQFTKILQYRWPVPDLRELKMPDGLFGGKRTTIVYVHDTEKFVRLTSLIETIGSGKNFVDLRKNQGASVDQHGNLQQLPDNFELFKSDPIMNPANEDLWIQDAQKAINKALGIKGGGGKCECSIVY